MTIFELREIALRYATQATAINMGGGITYAMPNVVVERAKVYLEFLSGSTATSEATKSAKRKKVRS